ncbi:uncharacterized protein B0T23DRAFT_38579 [Neurospora hispaniola]|uniref:Uncharacterized protein n=1 Tax=Neurospora hispaniola TaxID=588809 RepID=A0AAJ0IH69_9PEZI|nr:hypothetical protein B0T23DRAFT_38579 [Neurospora hispaniola]
MGQTRISHIFSIFLLRPVSLLWVPQLDLFLCIHRRLWQRQAMHYYKGNGMWRHHKFLAFCASRHNYCLLYFGRRAYCLVCHYACRRTCVWTKTVRCSIVYLSFEGRKGQLNDCT